MTIRVLNREYGAAPPQLTVDFDPSCLMGRNPADTIMLQVATASESGH
jgi:hypothetical protein